MAVGTLLTTIFPMLVDDLPLALGKIYFYEPLSLVHKPVYHDATLLSPWAQPVVLDAEGSATIFTATGGYDIAVQDADGVPIPRLSVEGYENVAETLLADGAVGGASSTAGARNVTNGYTVVAGDSFVTVNSAAGVTGVNLPTVVTRTKPVTLQNIGPNAVNVTPFGTQTIQLGAASAAYAMGEALAPRYPTYTFSPDPDALTWWVTAGSNN